MVDWICLGKMHSTLCPVHCNPFTNHYQGTPPKGKKKGIDLIVLPEREMGKKAVFVVDFYTS